VVEEKDENDDEDDDEPLLLGSSRIRYIYEFYGLFLAAPQ
jgi:hypothetical protein